ncbi:hypothetical protein CCMSSC00406_0005878 [Pleurotus cornucopiae]|uniref:Uncharacterized protein n=1 Tax=Pleurotus cornucopiae TaxID=5321 RepID=A0ACB7IJ01_PLECO|nr:hypothetical protein CCMSSC00406_0005878 [Pleurotus cornucopiae]
MVTVFIPSLSDPPTDRLELKIPLQKILSLCLSPYKWLCYVGWAIYNIQGYLSTDAEGTNRLIDGVVLNDEDILYFQAPGFVHEGVVQIALVKRHTASQTSVNDTRVVQYRTDISNRDGMCIFTGFTGQACHIIPFARGTGNMSILVHQRSITPAINDINDKRNGFLCEYNLHRLFDQRQVAVLVTPNDILGREDIPQAASPGLLQDLRSSPSRLSYTLQHINITVPQDAIMVNALGAVNNRDAKFLDCSRSGLPHAALLHYLYGASVVLAFGARDSVKTWQATHEWEQPPTQTPATRPDYKPRDYHDRQLTEEKRQNAYLASSTGVQNGGRLTEEEVMAFMFEIASRQVASREQAAWEQRKLEIDDWVHGVNSTDASATQK